MFLILLIVLALILLGVFCNTPIFYRESDNYSNLKEASILKGGEEFSFLENRDKAVLFVHGFPGSPKMFHLIRDLAKKDGYDIYNPRLPGFATEDRGDLIKTNFSMWYKYIKDYYINIRQNYKEFYIVGTSMGGALTLKLAEEFPLGSELSPTAIAVTSAPVFLNNLKRGAIRAPFLYIARVISLFLKYIPPGRPRKSEKDDQDGDTQWVGHRGLFPRQIYSLMMGLIKVRKDLKKVSHPCYLCQARKDRTVPFKNLYYIERKIRSKRIVTNTIDLSNWKHTNHSLFIYNSVGPVLWDDINRFFKSL